MTPKVVEIIAVRTRSGVTDEHVLEASEAAAGFMARQPGLLRRILARGEAGWLVCLEWRSRADAEASAQAFGGAQETAAFRALFEPGAVRVEMGEVRACLTPDQGRSISLPPSMAR